MSRVTFTSVPPNCRIVGELATPAKTTAKTPPPPQRTAPAPTVPPGPEVPATSPAEAKETGGAVAVRLARSGVRWYASTAADEGLTQVKFVGIPVERIPELVAAATALFPELRQY